MRFALPQHNVKGTQNTHIHTDKANQLLVRVLVGVVVVVWELGGWVYTLLEGLGKVVKTRKCCRHAHW